MNDVSGMDAVYFALLLILPISALVARRVPMPKLAIYALAWVGIAAAAFAIVQLLGLGKPERQQRSSGTVMIEGGAAHTQMSV